MRSLVLPSEEFVSEDLTCDSLFVEGGLWTLYSLAAGPGAGGKSLTMAVRNGQLEPKDLFD